MTNHLTETACVFPKVVIDFDFWAGSWSHPSGLCGHVRHDRECLPHDEPIRYTLWRWLRPRRVQPARCFLPTGPRNLWPYEGACMSANVTRETFGSRCTGSMPWRYCEPTLP
jgi:hypothetical protein